MSLAANQWLLQMEAVQHLLIFLMTQYQTVLSMVCRLQVLNRLDPWIVSWCSLWPLQLACQPKILVWFPTFLHQMTNLVVRYSTENPHHLQSKTAKGNPQSTPLQLSKALIDLFSGSWSVLSTESYKLSAQNCTTVFAMSPQAKTFFFPSTRKFASTFKRPWSSRRLESSESRNHEDPTRFPTHTKWASALIVWPLLVV